MSRKKTRQRKLAKLAERRAAGRRRKRRQRLIAIGVAFAVAIGGGALAFTAFTGSGEKPKAKAKPTATPAPTKKPKVTGRVSADVKPPKKVACAATPPPGADAKRPQFSNEPPLSIDLKATYLATIDTSCGKIRIELSSSESPRTVNSFVFLANHGFYDGQLFHRIANSIDVIQGGDPLGTGGGGPGYSIPDELDSGLEMRVGSIAMANAGPDTGGSQFFVVTGDKGTSLPPNYTIFGEVVGGLDVARKIQDVPVGGEGGETPREAVYIDSITIEEKK